MPAVDPRQIGLNEFSSYSLIIDARTPHEFREDHLPGAVNLPLVDDAQFAEVGTLHQKDPHAAYLIGARYASRNLSSHIGTHISKYGRDARFLVYCFRGGKRSRAWADTLRNIGFSTDVLKGGWKEYRSWVRTGLETLPPRFEYRVVSGMTGCGKTRLLHALEREGNQILDLEGLASHRGSLLGAVPGEPQPTQKRFDSLLLDRLRKFDDAKPVWVESESKKIGNLQLPRALFEAMRSAKTFLVTACMRERVLLLREDYPNFASDPQAMIARLAPLKLLVGGGELEHWSALVQAGRLDEMLERVLSVHYDPSYKRSRKHSSGQVDPAAQIELLPTDPASLASVASDLTRRFGAGTFQRPIAGT
jgi:tRNA 2-selenouridine synthase